MPRKVSDARGLQSSGAKSDAQFFSELYDGIDEYVARRDPDSHSTRQILLEVLEFKIPNLVSVLPDGFVYDSIAEVGSATGELIANFPARNGPLRRSGFDVSPLNVAAARARFPQVDCRAMDIRESEGSWDLVILSDVLEHVPDDVGLLAAAARRGSMVVVNLPLEVNWLNRARRYGTDDASGHLRAYSLEQGLDLARRAGLRVLRWTRVWSHETAFDVERRALRKAGTGYAYSGGPVARSIKVLVHESARVVPLLGRRLYPSNLFFSARVDR